MQKFQSDNSAGRPQPFTKTSQSGGVPLRSPTRPRHETVGRNGFTRRTRALGHSDFTKRTRAGKLRKRTRPTEAHNNFSKRTRAAAAARELAATGSRIFVRGGFAAVRSSTTRDFSYRAPALARSPRRAVSSTARSGMVSRNVAPMVPSTRRISPPWARTSSAAIASPSPALPGRVEP